MQANKTDMQTNKTDMQTDKTDLLDTWQTSLLSDFIRHFLSLTKSVTCGGIPKTLLVVSLNFIFMLAPEI